MRPIPSLLLALVMVMVVAMTASFPGQESLLIEAESFQDHGGWSLDTQFIETMGSPYLLAHGLGRPVLDARTTITVATAGRYRVFVRTLDWVARFDAAGTPGQFLVVVNGTPLSAPFGTEGKRWGWRAGGEVDLLVGANTVALRDLTGFDGRCDALYLTTSLSPPPDDDAILPAWRRKLLGLSAEPLRKEGYDLVVVGGGYAGMGAALSAARMGCRVALLQNRPVLGGNGSSEVRVWAKGLVKRGLFPNVGDIIEEFADAATASPGVAEEFGDARKEAIVRAEPNIDLFLNHHAYHATTEDGRITSVVAFDTMTSVRTSFHGSLFVDCTGHGTLGAMVDAEYQIKKDGRMGMSNMWRFEKGGEEERPFPKTPWALPLTMEDFPYPHRNGEWFWESGFDKDPLKDAEAIRDHNLRAVFGAFNAMKNGAGRKQHRGAFLTWVAYVGGTRESRRLMGDVILTEEDIVKKRAFDDGCVPSTWSIDLHYPKQQYAAKFPDNPFIAIAKHGAGVDRNFGYPIPYRCFYSRNVPNLFMAGRCISVTHEALGTVRVMKTCGMMGEVVGKAAWICRTQECDPRDVFALHLESLKALLRLPGGSRRAGLRGALTIPKAAPLASPPGFEPVGIVIDDAMATKRGSWQESDGVKPFFGKGYSYAHGPSEASLSFDVACDKDGRYEIRLAYTPHENRAKNVAVEVNTGTRKKVTTVNMQEAPPQKGGFVSLGFYRLSVGGRATVTVPCRGAQGVVAVDALQVLEAQ